MISGYRLRKKLVVSGYPSTQLKSLQDCGLFS